MYQFLDVEEFSPVRVIATVAKSYLHSPTPLPEVVVIVQRLFAAAQANRSLIFNSTTGA
jgi:hypothetical protein